MTNTRTFPEIWAVLSKDERDDLSDRLFRRKCCRTRQTVWNWGNGIKRPATPLVRDAVADVVSKMTGEKHNAVTLFPSK
jgi:hypothetical protein